MSEVKKEEKALVLTKDTNISDVMKAIKEKIASIQKIGDTPWLTSGNIGMGFQNIRTETKVENLIRMFSAVHNMEKSYNEVATMKEEDGGLGREKYPTFVIDNAPVEAIKKDIKLRIAIIEQDETLKTLQTMEAELATLLSNEDKKALVFAKMKDFLGA